MFVGTSPPARPAISIDTACEWPVPNACTTPPAAMASATSRAASVMASRWVSTRRSMAARIAAAFDMPR